MMLKWSTAAYQEFLIYIKILGQHMQSTELHEVWTECKLMGQNTAKNVMAGKDFSKAVVCAHEITS